MAFTGQWGSSAQLCVTMKAAAAIEKWKYVKVASQSDGYCAQAAAAGSEVIIGIAQNVASAAGEPVKVCIFGVSKCIAGDAVTKGVTLQSDADGECIAATTADHVVGIALEAAAAANDVITVTVGYAGIF